MCPSDTKDDWDQEASLAAMVARIEADRAAGLINPDDLDEDDGFLPFGDDWPDEGFVRLSDDWPAEDPAVTTGEADVSAPEHAPVPEGGPVPEHAPVTAGAPTPEDRPVPEVLDAGFLPRGRATGLAGSPTGSAGSPTGPPQAPPIPAGPLRSGPLPPVSPPVQTSPPEPEPPTPGPPDSRPGAGFAAGDALDVALPGPVLAGAADAAADASRTYTGISDDELIGVLTAWQRTESWAAAGRLSAVAELIRRRPTTSSDRARRRGAPAPWGTFCADELAAAVSISRWAADKMIALAYDLATRLPLTNRALHEGVLDAYKAQVIAEACRCLDDSAAARAEAAVVPHAVTGKTPGQIRALIARAVLAADPEAAKQRREQAQKDARVELWREDAGTAAIVGFGLPPDEALAADQQITSRAMDLHAAGVPGSMDALRVRAYLDALLGQDTLSRYQSTPVQPSTNSQVSSSPRGSTSASDSPGNNNPGDGSPARCDSGVPGRGQNDEPGAPAGDGTPGSAAPGPGPASQTGQDSPAPALIRPAAKINLTIPLVTLLGLAEHPGLVTGFGPIDPALARTLAAQAAGHPTTTWCITVTDSDGHPLAHGCARPGRPRKKPPRTAPPPRPGPAARPASPGSAPPPRPGPPPRPPSPGSTRPDRPSGHPPGQPLGIAPTTGPPGGYGTWRLRPPGPGRPDEPARPDRTGTSDRTGGTSLPDLTVDLEPIPVADCDHRYYSAGHDPTPRLRHLIEIRDGTCSWPPCQRDAARCDYEHTIAWEHGGPTCACNGGPRCRHHHLQKQAAGWTLTQPQPGIHTWTTPAGRTYTTGPIQYPI